MQIDIGTFAGIGAIPLIVALVYVARAYITDPRAWPILAVVLGVIWCVAVRTFLGDTWQQGVLEGIVVGTMSSSAWSVGKTFVNQ